METMEIHLDEHKIKLIQEMIKRGEYIDASDVVSEGLYYLEEEDKQKDVPLTLTPKACMEIALSDIGISDVDLFVEDDRNRKFCSAYTILENRMKKAGYITDENGDTHYDDNSPKPTDIFSRTIRGFYPNTGDEQIEAAWDLFIYHMERHENIKSNKSNNITE